MSGVRTRRQTSEAATPATPTPAPKDSRGQISLNGNGSAHKANTSSVDYPRENIFLFWPNIIGYSRIVLAIFSLYYMPLHPRTCTLLYSISCLLDALDGYAARYFEQSTRFGAVLDMVTDRCTTTCLLVFLSGAFPRFSLLFQALISLDLASHYMHMYATLVMGSGESHKQVDKSRSWILNLYYTNKVVLFVFCLFNELFFIALYLLSFSSPYLSPSLLQPISGEASSLQPGSPATASAAAKLFLTSPYSAGALELARANKMDSTIPWIIAGISFPIMFAKQFINIVQLVKASNWLAEGDLELRRELGLPRRRRSGKEKKLKA